MKAPFPYFGGKSRVASLVWERFGDVKHYIEPFAGSLAVLLDRPHTITTQLETVGDLNGLIANFWRALQQDPRGLAQMVDGPLMEVNMHSERLYLLEHEDTLLSNLMSDPDFYDLKMAAYWICGICAWVGSGYPHKEYSGRPQLHSGDGIYSLQRRDKRSEIFTELAYRLRHVRICCSSWEKLVTPYILHGKNGNTDTAIFLDPPYTEKADRSGLYAVDSFDVGHQVYEWALANSDNDLLKIAVCGYEGEYEFPDTWEEVSWTAAGGLSNFATEENHNRTRERIWFNKSCKLSSWEESPIHKLLNIPLTK
jgi:DNA adenine methylase